jgi:hypothetical protein
MRPIGDNPWDAIRRVYEHRTEPLTGACRRLGLNIREVYNQALAEGWIKDPTVRGFGPRDTAGRPLAAPKPHKVPRASPKRAVARRANPIPPEPLSDPVLPPRLPVTEVEEHPPDSPEALLAFRIRLFATITKKLIMLQHRIETDHDISAADSERQMREIAALISSYQRARDLNVRSGDAAAASGNLRHGARAPDPEELREELLRRVAGLRQQWESAQIP